MALPSSGSISLNQVNVELGNSGTATINMGSSAVRGLFDRASGSIGMGHGHGKANATALTISSNVNNYDIGASAIAAGGDKSTSVTLTINSGVTVGSTSAGTAAMYTGTGWSSGTIITITNNGSIVGASGSNSSGSGGGAGGTGGGGTNGYSTTSVAGSSESNGSGCSIISKRWRWLRPPTNRL